MTFVKEFCKAAEDHGWLAMVNDDSNQLELEQWSPIFEEIMRIEIKLDKGSADDNATIITTKLREVVDNFYPDEHAVDCWEGEPVRRNSLLKYLDDANAQQKWYSDLYITALRVKDGEKL